MNKKKGTLIKAIPIKRDIQPGITYDSILIFYRDENGKKQTKFIDRAESSFYILKDKDDVETIKNPPLFIEADRVEKKTVWSDHLFREIAIQTNSLVFYDKVNNTYNGRTRESNLKNLFKHNLIYSADMNLVDSYIGMFLDEFEPDISYKLHKVYFDIEVDLMSSGDEKKAYVGFPDEEIAPCPVALVTLFDGKSKIFTTFILDNPKNTSMQNLINKQESFRKSVIDNILDEDFVVVNGVDLLYFSSEEELITAFFKKIHDIDPDFALAWNQVFDVQTLMNRLRILLNRKKNDIVNGHNAMINIVSDMKYCTQKDRFGKDLYLTPYAYYVANKGQKIVDRWDNFFVLDGITWVDQMICYANVRKTTGLRESYSLDSIAYDELEKEKLEFGPGESHKNLLWKNAEKYVRYNIRDVLLLFLLEDKLLDMELLQKLSEITRTRKEKVFKKTVCLKNFLDKFALDNNYVMNNNKNANYGDEYEYFKENFLPKRTVNETDPNYKELLAKKDNYGAFVGDPLLNTNKYGMELNGKKSRFMFSNVGDQDLASLYPSIIRALNLNQNTLVGKFFLIDDETETKLKLRNFDGLMDQQKEEYKTDLGSTLTDFLYSKDIIKTGEYFFKLSNTEEIIEKIESGKYKNKK